MTLDTTFAIRPATPADVTHIIDDRRAGRVRKARAPRGGDREPCCTKACSAHIPSCEAIVGEADGEVVTFALFFHNFSTFLTKKGCIWKTCTCANRIAARAMAAACSSTWRASQSSAVAAASNGRCWTGICRQSISTIDGRRDHAGLAHLPRHGRAAGSAGQGLMQARKTHGLRRGAVGEPIRRWEGRLESNGFNIVAPPQHLQIPYKCLPR
jgi:hypothetical protein